jgi:uncharacterized protein (DUF849 family)
MEKLIITAALTGGGTIPAQSPYIPLSPDAIAKEAKRAADAGAAIVHIHPRDPEQGFPTDNLDIYEEIHVKIKDLTNAVICTSTGMSHRLSAEKRIEIVSRVKPEMASLSLGTILMNRDPLYKRLKQEDYRFDWEKDHLKNYRKGLFANTLHEIEMFWDSIIEAGAKPELEIFDLGWLTTLKYLLQTKGNYPAPIWLQFVMGAFGEHPAQVELFPHLKHTADTYLGLNAYKFSTIGIGYPNQFHMACTSIMMGGHVRVGLEDNLFIEKGVLARSNAEQVEKVVRLARELGRDIATADEAREMLSLKGMNQVAF